ncbi:CDP-diacylglycerol---serine O-phosphatidyltransferase [Spirosomataceae bacterium TFI 002]|nr:CDP-diacylglycerol---serine O-phosphatidyltransferase [Spirosomataceae bacterium TFI 002]
MKLFTIPNMITLANLTCGILGIWCIFSYKIEVAAFMIIIAAILDFFDGFFARLLNSFSEIGKQLDSLADMVSFGVLPSFILYYLLNQVLPRECSTCLTPNIWVFVSILPALASALRLAKFNIDTRQSNGFLGLPTPSNAIVVASFVLIGTYQSSYSELFLSPTFLIVYSIAISVLMISELPMASLKFKGFGWQTNKLIYGFLLVGLISLVGLKFVAIPLLITLYLVFSIISLLFLKKA